jgi:hypothetical protein
VQSSETVLGPIQGVSSPAASAGASADSTQQEQEQSEKKSDKKGDEGDDSGVDASLGLINSAPVQVKTDLEQPVTSGGMETMGENPGSPD